jgi:hypothetical protein
MRRVQPAPSPPGIGAGQGVDGIAVGLNAIGLLCIGAGNEYVPPRNEPAHLRSTIGAA